jgi:hypothetical protein
MTFCMTYDELLSSIIAGSVRVMSPGRATTSVPPSLTAADGSADGALLSGAVLPLAAGLVAAGDGDAAVPQAANMIAVAATNAPIRSRTMKPPPSFHTTCSVELGFYRLTLAGRDGRRE